jgi:HNH endonuclease/AP2 domain
MHRQIMNPPDGMDIDHWDNDGLCNCRKNLRICTRSQNNQNARKRVDSTHDYKGIYKTWNNKFAARLWHNGLKIHIGTYDTPEAAARAYDKKAKELFGEFANLNFPNE